MDQGRLLAADEGPGAQADFQVEIEARAENVLAQQAPPAALVDRPFDPPNGHGVFGTDVEEAAMGADGEAADEHAFNHVQRIAFQHAAVHERAGVAFVGVTDKVAGGVGRFGAHFPFLRRWDSRRRRGRGASIW